MLPRSHLPRCNQPGRRRGHLRPSTIDWRPRSPRPRRRRRQWRPPTPLPKPSRVDHRARKLRRAQRRGSISSHAPALLVGSDGSASCRTPEQCEPECRKPTSQPSTGSSADVGQQTTNGQERVRELVGVLSEEHERVRSASQIVDKPHITSGLVGGMCRRRVGIAATYGSRWVLPRKRATDLRLETSSL